MRCMGMPICRCCRPAHKQLSAAGESKGETLRHVGGARSPCLHLKAVQSVKQVRRWLLEFSAASNTRSEDTSYLVDFTADVG